MKVKLISNQERLVNLSTGVKKPPSMILITMNTSEGQKNFVTQKKIIPVYE